MRVSQLVTILAVSINVALVACGEGTGPGAGAPDHAIYKPSPADTIYVPTPLRFASWAPPLETYDTTFQLVQGEASADTIFFKARPGTTTRELFMVLAIPATATFVNAGGSPLPVGSTVNFSVKIDRDAVQLQFGPHGSTFTRKPARLYIWWQNTDLQGRSGNGLQLWYQPNTNTAWSTLNSQVSAAATWIVADLLHLSNYAVSY